MIRSLGLRAPVLVGQSYGGMMAADLAAHFPGAFSKLVLLDPIGLWRDDAPIPLMEFTSAMPDRQAAFLFHDPQCAAARALFTPPDDVEAAIAGGSAIVWALGCTGKFFWPIADHGLGKRLFRIAIPTLVVWGAQDTLVPPLYAQEFARGIRNSRVSIIENAGHVPQMEQTDATFAAVSAFLAS
jgi:pimeloyl-ACP methyl ester carboxylesterase